MEANCERNPLRAGVYIVRDADGYAFRAQKRKGFCAGAWEARPSHAAGKYDGRYFMADTLAALSRKVGASHRA